MLSFAHSLIVLAILNTAQAALYVTFPVQGDKCAVSQPCQIKWKDDSKPPTTSSYGETTIDLVTGNSSNLQAAQNLGGVSNPSTATALTFTPNATLSPTQQYAIRFISKGNTASPIFSTFFTITGGSGTATPIASNSSAPGSPSAIIGSKSPNVTAGRNTTVNSAANSPSSTLNSTASETANKSAASSMAAPFHAIIVIMGLYGIFKLL